VKKLKTKEISDGEGDGTMNDSGIINQLTSVHEKEASKNREGIGGA